MPHYNELIPPYYISTDPHYQSLKLPICMQPSHVFDDSLEGKVKTP